MTFWAAIEVQAADDTTAGHRCARVDMDAGRAECTQDICMLSQGARIGCDDLHLRADRIDVRLGPGGAFAGATATGDVLLVEGVRIVRCTRIELAPDQVRGQVDAATIEIKQDDAARDAFDVPTGRSVATAHGALRRLDATHLALEAGDFTLCDCGAGQAPSWRVDTSSIDIDVGDRATLWAPRIRVNFLGRFLVPITPPLLPLSIPLRQRAAGFLPPELAFYGPWPTVDLPFFIPVTNAWDVKVALGMRFDWGSHTTRAFGPQTLGAPRLGGRLRYAPSTDTTGSVHLQLTHDAASIMSERRFAADVASGNGDAPALVAQRRALTERIALDATHHSRLAQGIDWVLDTRWVSDDLVLQDFSVALDERFSTYWPSRTQILARHPTGSLMLAADYLLRLDNSVAIGGGARRPTYSNTRGAEAGTLQRGPSLAATLSPVPLAGPVHIDGSLSLVRFGAWTPENPHLSDAPGDPQVVQENLAGATLGLSVMRSVGPVHASARTGVDALYTHQPETVGRTDVAGIIAAELDAQVAGRHGDTLHVVQPRLAYRALAWPRHGGPARAPGLGRVDERQLRRPVHQGIAIVHQSFWDAHAPSGPVVSLDLGQPVDLTGGTLLQPWARLEIASNYWGQAHAFASVDTHQLNRLPLREVTLAFAKGWGPLAVSGQYERLAPNADRFARSMFELAAPRGALPPSPPGGAATWTHTVAGRAMVTYRSIFDVSYGATYQLPRPGTTGGEPACATAADLAASREAGQPLASARQCFTQHSVSLGYRSGCACWGVSAAMSAVPQDLAGSFRMQVLLDVAGFRVGS